MQGRPTVSVLHISFSTTKYNIGRATTVTMKKPFSLSGTEPVDHKKQRVLYLCPQIHAHTSVYTHMKETTCISSSRKSTPMLLCARCVLAKTRGYYLHWVSERRRGLLLCAMNTTRYVAGLIHLVGISISNVVSLWSMHTYTHTNMDRQIDTHTHTPLLNVGRSSRFWWACCPANTSTGSPGAWFERRLHRVMWFRRRGVCCERDKEKNYTFTLVWSTQGEHFNICRRVSYNKGGPGGMGLKLWYNIY